MSAALPNPAIAKDLKDGNLLCLVCHSQVGVYRFFSNILNEKIKRTNLLNLFIIKIKFLINQIYY